MSLIEIKNLKKVYKNQKVELVALSDINLSIKKGEIFGIIGLSGAGKSTLVRMMNYLEKPTEGEVYFEDRNLGLLKEKELREVRKKIGMIFQNFNLLEQSTVIKNVMFPLEISGVKKNDALKRARELLKLVDLSDKEKDYPSKLSGGQKQRVAIARALATNPKVLLCDEATSALDPKTTSQILSLLKRINKELLVTIVIITHQMSVIENICDRVAILDNSTVEEMGNVREVFKSPKSNIGKKLIFGATSYKEEDFIKEEGKTYLRMVFDGDVTDRPILADVILKFGKPLSILYANTKVIEGKVVGQLVVELSSDDKVSAEIKKYLEDSGIHCSEVV